MLVPKSQKTRENSVAATYEATGMRQSWGNGEERGCWTILGLGSDAKMVRMTREMCCMQYGCPRPYGAIYVVAIAKKK